jgi:hypothetical protein
MRAQLTTTAISSPESSAQAVAVNGSPTPSNRAALFTGSPANGSISFFMNSRSYTKKAADGSGNSFSLSMTNRKPSTIPANDISQQLFQKYGIVRQLFQFLHGEAVVLPHLFFGAVPAQDGHESRGVVFNVFADGFSKYM